MTRGKMRGKKFWEIRAAVEAGVGELLLYGPIGADNGMGWLFDEVTPRKFREELDALGGVSELRVFLNSEGGDVFAGQAIHSMLRRHPAQVRVFVDGLAASIASLVAMAGDKVIMPRNAMMMIHNPWTIGIGDAIEFRELADSLDKIREGMVASYQSKTGMERKELLRLLNAETWMTAAEAVEMGFADEIEETKAVAMAMLSPDKLRVNGMTMDLGAYRNRPRLVDSDPEGDGQPKDGFRVKPGMTKEEGQKLYLAYQEQVAVMNGG
jgi:ATP-dependent protease ClpP protease subunit